MNITDYVKQFDGLERVPLKLDTATDIKDGETYVANHIKWHQHAIQGSFVRETHEYHLKRYFSALLAFHGLTDPPRTDKVAKAVEAVNNAMGVEVITVASELPKHQAKKIGGTEIRFDGDDYDPVHDDVRLTGQIMRVFDTMKDGVYRTLKEISAITKDPEASISAQLRHLRKPRFGSHLIEKRSRGERRHGLYEYKLTVIPTECP